MSVDNKTGGFEDAASIVDKMVVVMLGDPKPDTILEFEKVEPFTAHEVLRALDDKLDFAENSYR